MKKNVEIELELTGEELADELWQMDSEEQANFLCGITRIIRFEKPSFLKQLLFVADEIENNPKIYNKAEIVRMLEQVLEYIKGEGEAE